MVTTRPNMTSTLPWCDDTPSSETRCLICVGVGRSDDRHKANPSPHAITKNFQDSRNLSYAYDGHKQRRQGSVSPKSVTLRCSVRQAFVVMLVCSHLCADMQNPWSCSAGPAPPRSGTRTRQRIAWLCRLEELYLSFRLAVFWSSSRVLLNDEARD